MGGRSTTRTGTPSEDGTGRARGEGDWDGPTSHNRRCGFVDHVRRPVRTWQGRRTPWSSRNGWKRANAPSGRPCANAWRTCRRDVATKRRGGNVNEGPWHGEDVEGTTGAIVRSRRDPEARTRSDPIHSTAEDRLEEIRKQVERKTEELLRAANQALKECVSELIHCGTHNAGSRRERTAKGSGGRSKSWFEWR